MYWETIYVDLILLARRETVKRKATRQHLQLLCPPVGSASVCSPYCFYGLYHQPLSRQRRVSFSSLFLWFHLLTVPVGEVKSIWKPNSSPIFSTPPFTSWAYHSRFLRLPSTIKDDLGVKAFGRTARCTGALSELLRWHSLVQPISCLKWTDGFKLLLWKISCGPLLSLINILLIFVPLVQVQADSCDDHWLRWMLVDWECLQVSICRSRAKSSDYSWTWT